MIEKYKNWIEQNVKDPIGNCKKYSKQMLLMFPELKLVRGHYCCPIWGTREHWWLTDTQNLIIDPTAKQFPSLGSGEYKPWEEGEEEPTGICMNCGGYCYSGASICSSECLCHVEEQYNLAFW